ncbi:MAG: zinc ribbon domain-containing protein [Chloroflexi bacterium]|nr:zinc ribbon domain-containing protein [Chloroflexota bacterium]
MPLYEYRCSQCGHIFEKMVRFSEANIPPECPICNSRLTQKQITSFATSGGSLSSSSGSSSSCGSSGRFT